MNRRSILRLLGLSPTLALPTVTLALPAPAPAPAVAKKPDVSAWLAKAFEAPLQIDIYYSNGKVGSQPAGGVWFHNGAVTLMCTSPHTGRVTQMVVRRGGVGLVRIFSTEMDFDNVLAGQELHIKVGVGC